MIKRGAFFALFCALGILFSQGTAGAEESFLSITRVSISRVEAVLSVGATVTSALGVQGVTAELYAGDEKISDFSLFDDGKHNDGASRDERWAGSLNTASLSPGAYDVVIKAQNRKGGFETSQAQQFLIPEPGDKSSSKKSIPDSGTTATGFTEDEAREQSQEDSDVLDSMIAGFLANAPVGGALTNNSTELQFKCFDERAGYGDSCANDFAVVQWRAPKQAVCTAHTSSINLKPQWSGQKKYVGSLSIGPLSATTTLEMKCVGGGLSTLAPSTTVTVAPLNTRKPLPALLCQQADGTFSKGPCRNSRAVLSWGPVPDSSSCTASASPASSFWRGSKPVQGAQDIEAVDVEKTFTLTCRNSLGIIKESVTLLPTLKKALPLIQKGTTASKIDVVFVGEGFADTKEFDELVRQVYAEGFEKFSPFKEHTSVFNIWTVRGEDLVGLAANSSCASGLQQAFVDETRLHNPFADKVVFISKKSFRSCAYLNGDSFNSFGDALADSVIDGITPGQAMATLFMHEFGHSFGGLADEYVEPANGDRPTIPNCLAPFNSTPASWIESEGTKHASFTLAGRMDTVSQESLGCSYVSGNRRPTPHSIMRFHFGGGNPFGPVNEEHLLRRMVSFENSNLTVFSPRGGEVWPKGSRQVVRWVTKNSAGVSKIELVSSGTQVVVSANPNDTDNAHAFTVPAGIPLGDYFVRVYSGTSTAQSVGAVTVAPPITGSLQVSLAFSGVLPEIVSAGETNVHMGNLVLRANNEPIRLERLAVQMSGSPALSSPQNITRVSFYDYEQQAVVGTAVFAGTSRHATTTFTQPILIPADDSRFLEVRVDLEPIGQSLSGKQGAVIQVDYDGDDSTGTQGTGMLTGDRISQSSPEDTAFVGVRVYKSFPEFNYSIAGAPATNGTNDLLVLSVRAHETGDVQLRKLSFSVSTTTARLTAPVLNGPHGSVGTAQLTRVGLEDIITVTFDNSSNVQDRTIPAGQTKQYVLRGVVSLLGLNNTGTVSTSLKSDFQFGASGRMANVADLATSNNIWSPNATTSASIVANDWTSSLNLPGCIARAGSGSDCEPRKIGIPQGQNVIFSGACVFQDPDSSPVGVVTRFSPGTASLGGQIIAYSGQSFSWNVEGDIEFYLRRVPPATTAFLEAFYTGGSPDLTNRVKLATASYYDLNATFAGASSTVLLDYRHSSSRGCEDQVAKGLPVRSPSEGRFKAGQPALDMRPFSSELLKK